jgi:hypothetical protein
MTMGARSVLRPWIASSQALLAMTEVATTEVVRRRRRLRTTRRTTIRRRNRRIEGGRRDWRPSAALSPWTAKVSLSLFHFVIITYCLEVVLPVILGEGIGKVVAWLAAIPP